MFSSAIWAPSELQRTAVPCVCICYENNVSNIISAVSVIAMKCRNCLKICIYVSRNAIWMNGMAENAAKLVVFRCFPKYIGVQYPEHHRRRPDMKQHEKHHRIRSSRNMKPQTQSETTASRSFIILACTISPTRNTPGMKGRHLWGIFSCNSCRDCEPQMSLPGAATMLFHARFVFIGGLGSSEEYCSRALFRKREVAGFCRKLGEF